MESDQYIRIVRQQSLDERMDMQAVATAGRDFPGCLSRRSPTDEASATN